MSGNPERQRAAMGDGPAPATGGRIGPGGLLGWLPWVAAAGLALLAGFLSEAYFAIRAELVGLRAENALAAIERQSLQQRLEAERILTARRIADLSADPLDQDHLARCDFIPLHAPDVTDPAVPALIVWDPRRQEGVLLIRHLPTVAAPDRYQLWTLDSPDSAAVPARAFTTGAAEDNARLPFKLERPAGASVAFLVTVGRDGAQPGAGAQVVLTSQ